jgi:hypothetical protein
MIYGDEINQILNVRPWLRAEDQVSDPYKTTGRSAVLYILIKNMVLPVLK